MRLRKCIPHQTKVRGRHKIGPTGQLEAHMENLSDLRALLDLANDNQPRDLSRRSLLARASVFGVMALASAAPAQAEITNQATYAKTGPYGGNTLPAGVRVRLVPHVHGLTVNMIEAGKPGSPLVLLLHGFPNLGYSWRKVMPALAAPGYYAVSPLLCRYRPTPGLANSFDALFTRF